MRMYLITAYTRSTEIGGSGVMVPFAQWRTVDGVGTLVRHTTKEPPTDEEIRRHLHGRQKHEMYFPGSTIQEALAAFVGQEGYKAGDGASEERRGRWIDPETPILELPDCPFMFKNRKEELICGEEDPVRCDSESSWYPGVHGMCFIEGFDAPSFCPVDPVLRAFGEHKHQRAAPWEIEFNGRRYHYIPNA